MQEDGSYVARAVLNRAGIYRLIVSTGPDAVIAPGFPKEAVVLAGEPVARTSSVIWPRDTGRLLVAGGSGLPFHLALGDAGGNVCRIGQDLTAAAPSSPRTMEGRLSALTVAEDGKVDVDAGLEALPAALRERLRIVLVGPEGQEQDLTGSLRVIEDGSAIIGRALAPKPGLYRLEVELDGKPVAGSPFALQAAETLEAARGLAGASAAAPAGKDWDATARAAYAEVDGSMEGYDGPSSPSRRKDSAQDFLPGDVPVVERVEDVWKAVKLQSERSGATASGGAKAW